MLLELKVIPQLLTFIPLDNRQVPVEAACSALAFFVVTRAGVREALKFSAIPQLLQYVQKESSKSMLLQL